MNHIRKNGFLLKVFSLFPVLFLCLLIQSCGQDSLFYDISIEPEPKDPLIPGSPTNMALVKNRMYVGTRMSGKIFSFGGANLEWDTVSLPSGSLGELASDGNYLYALIFPSGDPISASAVRRYDPVTKSWDMNYTVSNYSIQTIYGAGGKIFCGAQFHTNRENFALLYIEPSTNSLSVIRYSTSLLKGAALSASGNIYLVTMGSGMFIFNESTMDTTPVGGTSEGNFAGIINSGGGIVAVTSNGAVYTDASGVFSYVNTGENFTGALSVWMDSENQWRPSLLLMGIRGRGSSYTHGYLEMVLSNGTPTFNIKSPGDSSPTSVKNKAKYSASIGTHPVMSILQAPDISNGGPLNYRNYSGIPGWEPPIFASTSLDGIWSYRDGEWNAEE